MAQNVSVLVKGQRQLIAGSKVLYNRIDRRAPQDFTRFTEDLASELRGRLPKRTGRLAARTRGHQQGRMALLQMGEDVPYAGFVEYGGRGFPPGRGNYMGKAYRQAMPWFKEVAEKVATDEIARMRWPSPM